MAATKKKSAPIPAPVTGTRPAPKSAAKPTGKAAPVKKVVPALKKGPTDFEAGKGKPAPGRGAKAAGGGKSIKMNWSGDCK